MKKHRLAILVICILPFLGGCSQDQINSTFDTVDPVVSTVEQAHSVVVDAVESPAGEFIPIDIKIALLAGLSVLSGIGTLYQTARKTLYKTAVVEVASGFENVKENNPDLVYKMSMNAAQSTGTKKIIQRVV